MRDAPTARDNTPPRETILHRESDTGAHLGRTNHAGLPRVPRPQTKPDRPHRHALTGHRYRSVRPPLRQSLSSLCTPARHGLCCPPSLCRRPNTSQPTHLATWRQATEPEGPPAEGDGGGGRFFPRGLGRPTSAAAAAASASAIAFACAASPAVSIACAGPSSSPAAELLPPLCRELVLAGFTLHSANDGACTAAPATVDLVAATS